MSNMPGHDMSDMPPPAVIPDDDTTPPNVALGSDPVHNDGDVRFAQHMVPHHSQAVEMIDIILAKPDLDPRVRDLALKIKADEVPEISAMKGWLKLWGNPAMLPNPHGTHGILSPAEIAQLKAARGAAASILFLKEMISHHEGAIAASEVQIGEGKNRPALALAESIVEQQKADIVLMKSYLASPGQPAAPAPEAGAGTRFRRRCSRRPDRHIGESFAWERIKLRRRLVRFSCGGLLRAPRGLR